MRTYTEDKWRCEMSPCIPGAAAPAGGVCILVRSPVAMVETPARTRAFVEARAAGRAAKYVGQLAKNHEIQIFVVYGMARGHDSKEAAAATDAVCSAILEEANRALVCNAVILGDLHADPQDIPSLKAALEDEWVDVGHAASCIAGTPEEPTCRVGAEAVPTRRDYIFVRSDMWPDVCDFGIEHSPLIRWSKSCSRPVEEHARLASRGRFAICQPYGTQSSIVRQRTCPTKKPGRCARQGEQT